MSEQAEPPPLPPSRGLFVAFSGGDGTGKSTQVRLLAALVGQSTGTDPLVLAFPDRGTAVGQLLAQHLTGTRQLTPRVSHLLFSANRWELVPRIERALAAGRHVLVDRYWYSGAAYTLAQDAAPIDWCLAPDALLPQPDVVFKLSAPIAVCARRCAERAGKPLEVYETSEFQRRVAHQFDRVFERVDQFLIVCIRHIGEPRTEFTQVGAFERR